MPDQQSLPQEILQYGDHSLQTVSVTTLPHVLDTGYWVILIHGGGWRDPTQNAEDFLTAASSILQTHVPYPSQTLPHIAAFATISYRLSPHPNHPQSRPDTSTTEFRDAKHPDHLRDVQAALALLQTKYRFGERYILVGHSAGATLSFQAVMGSLQQQRADMSSTPLPTAILGTGGIYDIRLLRDTHLQIPVYHEFLAGAFGDDEAQWDAASPAKVGGADGVEGGWTNGRLAVIAYSVGDSLVDPGQGRVMRESLRRWEEKQTQEATRRVAMLSLTDEHDASWEKGEELARAIAFTFDELRAMGVVS